ncbi:hypothetical protein D3C85_1444760 [compost metagenome]
MQNRSANAALCVCNRHSIGAAIRKGTDFTSPEAEAPSFSLRTAVSAAAAMARRDAVGDKVTPLPWPCATLVCTHSAPGNVSRVSEMNTSSPVAKIMGTPISPASAPYRPASPSSMPLMNTRANAKLLIVCARMPRPCERE